MAWQNCGPEISHPWDVSETSSRKNPKKICCNKPSLKKKLHCEKNLYLSNALLGKARMLGGGPSSTASIGTCTSSFPDIIIKSLHNKSTFSKRLSFISDCCALPSRNTRWTTVCAKMIKEVGVILIYGKAIDLDCIYLEFFCFILDLPIVMWLKTIMG